MEQPTTRKVLRSFAEFLVVGVCTIAFALNAVGIADALLTNYYAGARDLVSYWAAGQQLAHHADPYDGPSILALERSVGFADGVPALIMRNPPPALPLVFALGFLGIRSASLLWSALVLIALLLSIRIIAAMHRQTKNPLNLLALSFAPVLSCLIAGQIAAFVLLGLVLFLRLHRTRPLLAGLSLFLCALKPHLFLPFGVVLLAWIIVSRSYRVLLGALLASGLGAAAAALIDPQGWAQYAQMLRAQRLETQLIPSLSSMLRQTLAPQATWLQFLPAALGCLWALAYFRRHRHHWDWLEHGSLLVLVSVVVAPYSWFMDQALALPAILHALYRCRSRVLVAALALLSACIQIANVRGVSLLNSTLYNWTALLWLLWYLCADRSRRTGTIPSSLRTATGVTPAPRET